jgi:nucleoside-diphosphate-sugar epimerase
MGGTAAACRCLIQEAAPMAEGRDRVLVTGAAGFIGACLTRDLLGRGQDVHLILRPGSDTWRLVGLEGKYTVHWADLRDAEAVPKAVDACRPAVVYHLAAHGVYPAHRDRTAILSTNILGTANLLDALHHRDFRALVNAGSFFEYGHKNTPLCEVDRLEPRTDYAVAKAAATLLCQAEAYRGMPVVTVRIFSVYGPWESPSRLVPYVMDCCRRGEPPRVSAGTQLRDFIHVDDVISLLRTGAELPERGPILHAGTGRPHSVREMVETILSVCTGGRLRAEFGAVPTRPGEAPFWAASIADTTAQTGWTPRFDLRAGIQRTWEWFSATHGLKAA